MKYVFTPIAFVSLLVCVWPFAVVADAGKTPGRVSTANEAPEHWKPSGQRQLLAEKNRLIVNDARDALYGTQQALIALDKQDGETAQGLLQAVAKKLNDALKANPNIALIVADVDTETLDFTGDADAVKNIVKQATRDLGDGKLQDARAVLAGVASEIRITSISIPLGSYTVAVEKAETLIESGKLENAALVLDDVLDTLVEETEVFPLPVLRAEVFLTAAAELEHKDNLSEEKSREVVLENLIVAKEELQMAELLGYGGKEDYKTLYTAIDEIKAAVHAAKSDAAWAKFKQVFKSFKNKLSSAAK